MHGARGHACSRRGHCTYTTRLAAAHMHIRNASRSQHACGFRRAAVAKRSKKCWAAQVVHQQQQVFVVGGGDGIVVFLRVLRDLRERLVVVGCLRDRVDQHVDVLHEVHVKHHTTLKKNRKSGKIPVKYR